MFQESLVESTPLLRSHNRWPVFISVAMQATILALAVAIPLLHPEVLPRQALNKLDFLPAPRIKPPTPPPPPPPVRVQTATENNAPVAPPMQAPQLPTMISEPLTSDAPPVTNALLAIPSGVAHPSTIITPSAAPPAPHVAPAPAPAANIGRLNISEGVLAGNLLVPIRPEYPAIAKVAHVEGTVIVQATISTAGRIENPHVVSGPPMLQRAALDAVSNARYRPYLLNHQPTEVETTFSINFRLNSN